MKFCFVGVRDSASTFFVLWLRKTNTKNTYQMEIQIRGRIGKFTTYSENAVKLQISEKKSNKTNEYDNWFVNVWKTSEYAFKVAQRLKEGDYCIASGYATQYKYEKDGKEHTSTQFHLLQLSKIDYSVLDREPAPETQLKYNKEETKTPALAEVVNEDGLPF